MKKVYKSLIVLELIVGVAPSFLLIASSMVLLPHQVFLLIESNRWEAGSTVFWVIGGVIGFLATIKVVASLFKREPNSNLSIFSYFGIFIGLVSLLFGPYGLFPPGGVEVNVLTLFLCVIPMVVMIHLSFLAYRKSIEVNQQLE